MRADVRYAGLNGEAEQRVRLAAQALAAYKIRAVAGEWDGTRCDLLIVDGTDGYGRHALDVAARRGTRALALGGAGAAPARTALTHDASVAMLTKAMREALDGNARIDTDEPAASEAASAPSFVNGGGDGSGLLQLARHPEGLRNDLDATVQGRSVLLSFSSGRVLAASLSDLLGARDRLGEDGWEFRVATRRSGTRSAEVASSLDAFCLQGAWRARAQLPAFAADRYELRDWPDLGAAADSVDALRIVQVLLRGPASSADIARATGCGAQDIAACLWAFSAAGLLERSATVVPAIVPVASKPRTAPSLMARLVSHFGLVRR